MKINSLIKQHLKKAISLILVFALIFSLAACGGNKSGNNAAIDNISAVKALNLKNDFLTCDTKAYNLQVNYRYTFFVVDENPTFTWNMVSSVRGEKQIAYAVGVASTEEKAKNGEFDVWNSGIFAGSAANITYGAEGGFEAVKAKELKPQTVYYYGVQLYNKDGLKAPIAVNSFETGLMGDFGKDNKWIDVRLSESEYDLSEASTLFRRQFTLSQNAENIAKARLYATAAGNHIMYVNGVRAGNDYMAPGKTNVSAMLYYQTYDITDKLISGDNTIAAEVGYGWYNSGAVGDNAGKNTALKAKLVVTYKDGSTQIIDTDDKWQGTKDGHTTVNQYYKGQWVDANRKIPNWNKNNSNSSKWKKVYASDTFSGSKPLEIANVFRAELMEPVTVVETFNPISVEQTEAEKEKNKAYIYKIEQNIAGTLRLKASAPKGTEITIYYNEYPSRVNGGYQGHNGTDKYVFAGSGVETVEFDLVYHGFQYIIIEGLNNPLPLENIEALAFSTLDKGVSTFESSNSEMNQFVKNLSWTLRSNFVSTITDCPTREKNTWTGDSQAISATSAYLFNTYNSYKNFIYLMKASQNADGGISPILGGAQKSDNEKPGSREGDCTPIWCDAMVIIPWNMYLAYGDITVLTENYEAMKNYMEYAHSKYWTYDTTDSSNEKYYIRKGDSYGDWLGAYGKTNKKYSGQGYYVKDRAQGQVWVETHYEDLATAYAAYMSGILSDAAEILGKEDDAKRYAEMKENYAAAWRRVWLEEDGVTPKSRSQTSYSLGLAFGLYESDNVAKASKQLAELVKEDGYKQTSGFPGTNYIYRVLHNNGFADVAFDLFFNDSGRSSVYAIRNHQATTIPESLERETGNHFAFGTPVRWIFSDVLGISEGSMDNVGFNNITIAPTYNVKTGVTWAKGTYQSAAGEIAVDWKLSNDGKTFTLKCEIPANSQAVIALPINDNSNKITEGELDAKKAEGLEFLKYENGRAYFNALSGEYNFTVTY